MDNKNYKEMLMDRSYAFSVNIIKFINTVDKHDFSKEILAKQLIRSATSIGANIVEAQASSSRKDFTNFISYALKSANETIYWLRLFRESFLNIKTEQTKFLLEEAVQLGKILGASIISLKNKR